MIHSRLVYPGRETGWVEIKVTEGGASIEYDIDKKDAQDNIDELFGVILNISELQESTEREVDLFEYLIRQNLCDVEIEELVEKLTNFDEIT